MRIGLFFSVIVAISSVADAAPRRSPDLRRLERLVRANESPREALRPVPFEPPRRAVTAEDIAKIDEAIPQILKGLGAKW